MAQLPAKQDQYVKYAEKDSKGRNIANEVDTTNENVDNVTDIVSQTEISAVPISTMNGLKIKNYYCKVVKTCHVLSVIVTARYENETESAISFNNYRNYLINFNIPEEIGDKIIRFDGSKVSESPINNNTITLIAMQISNSNDLAIGTFLSSVGSLYSISRNRIDINFLISSITIQPGGYLYLSSRFDLYLD